MNLLRALSRLLRNRSGVAMTEFALGAPFLMAAGLWGTEVANYALVNMKIGQLTVHIADNASRIGDTSTLQNRKIYESDINDLLIGTQIQAGSLDLFDNGRVIISSLEVNESNEQYIHWQRCRGIKNIASSYGDQDDTLAVGMGPEGEEVFAQEGEAVIFVEVRYTYQPLISAQFMGSLEMSSIASFTVRDNRDLAQIYQRNAADPDPVQRCNAYSGNVAIGKDGTVS
jgi:Flp pilus assembly protein TadG